MRSDGAILALGMAGVLAAASSLCHARGSGARQADDDARKRSLVCDILEGEGVWRVSEQTLRLVSDLSDLPLDDLERAAAEPRHRRKLILLRTLSARLGLEDGSAEAERLSTCLATLSNETLSGLAVR